MNRDGACKSLWQVTANDPVAEFPGEAGERIFDVVIAGGGITGITTGLLLQKAGKSVLIAEAHNTGFGTTGGTSAHLNTFLDTSYGAIEKNFGEGEDQLVADGVQQALDLIDENVEVLHIDCGYEKKSAYMFSADKKQTKELDAIYESCTKVRVDVAYTPNIPLKTTFEKALVFKGQRQIHPLKYLASLAREFVQSGGVILESCRIMSADENQEPIQLSTNRGTISGFKLIYATHIPPGVNLLHFRCAPYRSYVMAVTLENDDDYPDAMIYDLEDPYHYIRTQEIDGEKYLLVGGEDHKTGHEENTEHCFRKLESFIRTYFPVKEIKSKWSSQYFEPVDGLPYIGNLPGSTDSVFVATGFGGNGMMHSAIAAITLTELILTGKSKYAELFDPNRIKMVAGFSNFIKEAADVAGKFVSRLLPSGHIKTLSELARGEAKIVDYEGQKMGIYKDDDGSLHAVHTACTHIRCDVSWNTAEKSWDCPCHGSRFSIDGEVLTAPARKDLSKIDIASE